MPRPKNPNAKVRVPLRLNKGLYDWMERVRVMRGYNRTQMIELGLHELRERGVPTELPAELREDE